MTRENEDRGRLAKSSGDFFEHWIDDQHTEARNLLLLAHVEHNQARAKVLPGGALTYVGKGPSDYAGMLADGGRTYASEAKSTKDVSLKRSAIKKKQVEHLDAVAAAGGLALLLAEFRAIMPLYFHHEGTLPRRYAIPWLEVPWKVKRTAASIVEADIAKWLVEPGTCFLSRFTKPGPPGSVKPAPGRVYPRG